MRASICARVICFEWYNDHKTEWSLCVHLKLSRIRDVDTALAANHRLVTTNNISLTNPNEQLRGSRMILHKLSHDVLKPGTTAILTTTIHCAE